MGYQLIITADTPDSIRKELKALSDAMSPPVVEAPIVDNIQSEPKRRGRPAKQQTIDATAVEKSVAQTDLEEAIEAVMAVVPPIMDAKGELAEPKTYTKDEIADLLREWNSEMKMIPAAVAAAKNWLLRCAEGEQDAPKHDAIDKLSEQADAPRLLTMQLLQTVGAGRISTIPEDKYADVVAFIDAQRAQFA
jgi:hypothetical protein